MPEVGSTMDLARNLGPVKAVVLTDHQTAGRGRWNRTWEDSHGKSVLMTVVEPFTQRDPNPSSPVPTQLFTLAACIALQAAAHTQKVSICWPNDLVVSEGDDPRKKVGGILVETPDYSAHHDYAKLFGIGINVYPQPTQQTDYPVVSMSELSPSITRHRIVTSVLRLWESMKVDMNTLNSRAVYDHYNHLWRKNSYLLQSNGRIVRIHGIGNNGTEYIEGKVIGSPIGTGLFIETEHGIQEINEFNPQSKVEVVA